jgi:hypothetical protein
MLQRNRNFKKKKRKQNKKQILFITEMNDDYIVHHYSVDSYSKNNQLFPWVLLLEWRDEGDFHSAMLMC